MAETEIVAADAATDNSKSTFPHFFQKEWGILIALLKSFAGNHTSFKKTIDDAVKLSAKFARAEVEELDKSTFRIKI